MREIVFIVKEDEVEDLFYLLEKHNVKFENVIQKEDTYELDLSEWCD